MERPEVNAGGHRPPATDARLRNWCAWRCSVRSVAGQKVLMNLIRGTAFDTTPCGDLGERKEQGDALSCRPGFERCVPITLLPQRPPQRRAAFAICVRS